MEEDKKKENRKIIAIIAVTVVVVLLIVGGLLIFRNNSSEPAVDTVVKTESKTVIAGELDMNGVVPEGTVVTLYIPSGYGYGPNDLRGNSGTVIIPADSNLIFEIELIAVL